MRRQAHPFFNVPETNLGLAQIETTDLNELHRRFAILRRDSQRGAKVPRALRAAVVAALRQGVPLADLRRACGITTRQLEYWQRSDYGDAARTRAGEESARIFSVIEETPRAPAGQIGCTAEQGLELRLGPWAVSVRLVEQQTRRG